MTHLADGELRRLVDDGPDAAAGAHLAACPSCSARRDTLAETAAATRAALGAAPAAETLNAGSAHAVVRARILAQPPSRARFAPGRLSWLLVPLAACAVVALFVATPLRSVAENFLAIFEPQQFAALPVSRADFQQLRALPDLSAFGTMRGGQRTPDVRVENAREAENAARFPLHLPTAFGSVALDQPRFDVVPQHFAQFTFSAAKARAAAGNRRLPPMPPWIDGSTIFA